MIMIAMTSCKQKVDLLVYNADVYTVNENFDRATSFAAKDGRIVAVGNDEEIRKSYTSDQIVDAEGHAIYPGFNDGHSHFLGYGLSAFNVNLVGTTSFDEVIERVADHHKKFPSEWITGRGWDQNDWEEKEFPTKEKLDEAFPNTPVVLRRIDGHALIANSEAMKRAEITVDSYVPGGDILKVNGEPTGIFIDKAMSLIGAAIPVPSDEQMIRALKKAQEDCFAVGLTTVSDAGLSKKEILLIDSLHKAGELKMRVYAMMNPSEENFEYFFSKEPILNGKLTVSAVKLYIDGALGSRGALLLAPYSDDPENFGLQLNVEQYYYDICNRAYNAGYQVNTHAIGDSGNRIMLNTYARFLGGKNDRRWRVEHAQIVHPEDFKLFKEFNIIPSVQSTHCTSDMYWADERLGEERIKTAYAYKELLKQNGWLVNGTDFPVEGISPLHTFYAAVARKDLEGWPEEGFEMENALDREDALRSVTIWPAKGSFDEDFKGSIEIGKVADFVILDKDLMQIDEEELPSVKVLATYLGGKPMYQAE
ncbi:MAG: amidohydrolase [Bacteroidetes bacterium]|nr:amidohydrolase [Bacteroidota bacterium]